MKIIEIHRREDYNNFTFEYLIIILGIRFHRVLPQEYIISQKDLPLWLRFSKWLLQKTCKPHKWKKNGVPHMEGYFLGDVPVTVTQQIICENCEKIGSFKYEFGVDTSF